MIRSALVAALLAAPPAFAQPACTIEAGRSVAEAGALRVQARQEARSGDRGRTCETLDEAGDRYGDARDVLDECGLTVTAIELRGQLRAVRQLKHFYRCEEP